MLAAGIDVISTVNIQHLESLNDSIFEITGVRVRETFPDRILDEADEVVLVDLSPEALQERLRAGKVYKRERAQIALDNFFRIENLGALRELALRELAEDVEHRRKPILLDPSASRPSASACWRWSSRSRSRSGSSAAPGAPRSGWARRSTRVWVKQPGHEPDGGGGDAARGSEAPLVDPRRPLPRGGGRRPGRRR